MKSATARLSVLLVALALLGAASWWKLRPLSELLFPNVAFCLKGESFPLSRISRDRTTVQFTKADLLTATLTIRVHPAAKNGDSVEIDLSSGNAQIELTRPRSKSGFSMETHLLVRQLNSDERERVKALLDDAFVSWLATAADAYHAKVFGGMLMELTISTKDRWRMIVCDNHFPDELRRLSCGFERVVVRGLFEIDERKSLSWEEIRLPEGTSIRVKQ